MNTDFSSCLDESIEPLFPESIKLQEKKIAMDLDCRYEGVFDDIDVVIDRTDRGYAVTLVKSIVDETGRKHERQLLRMSSGIPPWTSRQKTSELVNQVSKLSDLQDRSENWVRSQISELFAMISHEAETEGSNLAWLLASPGVKTVMEDVIAAIAWPSSSPNTATYDIYFKGDGEGTQRMELPLSEWATVSPIPFIRRYVCVYPVRNCPIQTRAEWVELKERISEIMELQEREEVDPVDDMFMDIREHVNRMAIWTKNRNDCANSVKYVYCEEIQPDKWHLHIQSRFIDQALGDTRSFEKHSAVLSKGLRARETESPLVVVKQERFRGMRCSVWIFKGEAFEFDPQNLIVSDAPEQPPGDDS